MKSDLFFKILCYDIVNIINIIVHFPFYFYFFFQIDWKLYNFLHVNRWPNVNLFLKLINRIQII